MTSVNYTTNIPNPPNFPSQDVSNMQTNTNSTKSIFEIDHVGFNNAQGGYHNIIHQPVQGGTQAPIVNLTQLYAVNYTPNTTGGTASSQLYMTNSGGTVQMTGTLQTSDGWAWVNGMLLQWGSVTGKAGLWPVNDQTLTFKDRVVGAIPFPNSCFVVLTTFIGPTSSSSADICINSVSSTNFHWQFTGSSSASFDGFYWFAIGR